MTVLVTRPSPDGERLCAQLHAAGFKPVFFPAVAIVPPSDPSKMQQQLAELAQYDWVIFTSPQAVYHSATIIKQWPAHVKIAVMGPGTARAVAQEHWPIHLSPKEQCNSEALLSLAPLQTIASQKIALIQGEQGRAHLRNTLILRHAEV